MSHSRIQDLFRSDPEDQRTQHQVDTILESFLTDTYVSSAVPERELEIVFAASTVPSESTTVLQYFSELVDQYIPHSSRIASPRSFAHMTSTVPLFMRHLASLIVGMNQNLVKQDASRALTCIERQTLAMMHRLAFGESDEFYRQHTHAPESSLGIVSSGSTLANIIAIWCARNARLPEHSEDGFCQAASDDGVSRRYVVLGSRLMHYSFAKAADLLGLGKRGLITLPVDASYRLDLAALRAEIARCRTTRSTILAIVGVAGTTDVGSIDPLEQMAHICHEEGIHFHVDAAWGGPLLFSERHRRQLAGIERADSVTFDGHKQLHLPMGIGMLLLRSPELAKVIEKEAPYLIRAGTPDLGRRALEGSRAGSVLYLHAALHIFGQQGYAALVDDGIALAKECGSLVTANPAFELLAEPELRVVVYRYVPTSLRQAARTGTLGPAENAALDEVNRRLYALQKADGQSLVSMTTLPTANHGDVVALRAVIANPTTSEADFHLVLQHQAEIGSMLERSDGPQE